MQTNISTYFDLNLKQEDLDFLDVKLDDDNLLFIDPRLLEKSKAKSIVPMSGLLYRFLGHLILSVVSNKLDKTRELLSGIKEPKETRLGYGDGNSDGNSAGPVLKEELIKSIINNPIIREQKINNFSEIGFYVEKLSCDRISDITTKIIESELITYTQKQCKKHSIPLKIIKKKKLILNASTLEWENLNVELPIYIDSNGNEKPIIFVPKTIAYTSSGFSSSFLSFYRFARNYIIEIKDTTFLNGVLRNGKNDSILVNDFDTLHPNKKEALVKWVLKYNHLPNNFWLRNAENVTSLSDAIIGSIVYS